MEVTSRKQVFNLWDTNGRRGDVLNALEVYLKILDELKSNGSTNKWGNYPNSTSQFEFYRRAIEESPEIFKNHPKYDAFISAIGKNYNKFITKDPEFIKKMPIQILNELDKNIEARSRHYSSNLVRIGFASKNRNITAAGYDFLNLSINLDEIEKILPLDMTNIILLRQLMKLKIFTKENKGIRKYYSPFFMALFLLLLDKPIDRDTFENIVQGTSPYLSDEIKNKIISCGQRIEYISNLINDLEVDIPAVFKQELKISKEDFCDYIKNTKSQNAVSTIYYPFYSALYDYIDDKTDENYLNLKNTYCSKKEFLKKAFGRGNNIFDFGANGIYSQEQFTINNAENRFLLSSNINEFLYKEYEISKYVDSTKEYSDTTLRMLKASGIFKFKNIPELSFKNTFKIIFSKFNIGTHIFGEMSNEEYENYEENENSLFGNSESLIKILNYNQSDVVEILKHIFKHQQAFDEKTVKSSLQKEVSNSFAHYVEKNYPVERIIELLKLFSDRNNDARLIKEVSDSADVPTIFEYVVGIAWYYIFNKSYDLYESLNLTLNADFEPERHAGGGEGDILIDLADKSIMVEVTLMNANAQKRGEWEPVLRHSLNNAANNENKNALTFFVADKLDFNTINIWRAVSAVPLKSTSTNKIVNGLVIMPITNNELIIMLSNKISADVLIDKVEKSFMGTDKILDDSWRTDIIRDLT